jgi:N-acetylglutamate synthase-like GNAT family acetyltransferase
MTGAPRTSLPSDVSLRPALAADQEAIRELVQANHLNPLSLQWPHFIVAVDSSARVVGIGQIKPHADGSRELASIAVVPSRRKQGIAQAIILDLLRSNPPPLYLTCREAMGPFYARFGFAEVSLEQMPPYFRRIYRLARLLMRATRSEARMLVMRRLE